MYVDEKNRADQLQVDSKRLSVEVEGLKKEWQEARWGFDYQLIFKVVFITTYLFKSYLSLK